MSLFDEAMALVIGDANIGADALFRRPPATEWTALRAVLSRPADVVPGFGAPGARAGALDAVVRSIDLAAGISPQRGDELSIGGTTYRVEAADPDVMRITWRLTLGS